MAFAPQAARSNTISLHFVADENGICALLKDRRGAFISTIAAVSEALKAKGIRPPFTATTDSQLCASGGFSVSKFEWEKQMLTGTIVEGIGVLHKLLELAERCEFE